MAGSFRIAEGYVEVSADESAYDRAMQRLRSKKNKVDVNVQLDDRDAVARLDRLMRDRSLNVAVRLDQTALSRLRLPNRTVDILAELSEAARVRAEEQLTQLTRDRTVRIIADLDTRAAADDLALLTRARTARITADADTRVAADDLALLTRNRTVNVRVDVDRSALALLGSLGSAGSSVGMLSSRFVALAAAALSALPTVSSLTASIIQMGPAAALAAPALGSLVTMGATLGVGLHGIGAAFKQAFAPASSGAKTATTSIRQVENAQRSLARAQQGVKDAEVRAAEARVQAARQIQDAQRGLKATVQDVADANRRAAEQVAQAEEDLADAQRSARQAQLDLTAARKDAARQLQDLANQQEDVELDRREAVLRVQDAEEDLAKVMADPKATEKQRAEAQLTRDQALQHLEEIQLQQQRLTADAAAANKAGVEGSKQVTDAKKQVADANDDITDKTKALKDAELEQARAAQQGAEKVAAAERAVADARTAAAKAALDGARSIVEAQQAVADAARGVAEAQTAGAAATAKTADALAKLSPNARAFVNAVRNLGPAFADLRMDVQDRLFRGLGESMTRLGTAAAPAVRSGLVGMAGVLNGMARSLMDTFTRLADQGLLQRMFDGFTNGMKPLEKVPGQLGQAFVELSVAAAPAFKRITTAMAGESDKISDRLAKAFESGRLEQAIDHAIEIGKRFGRLIADAFGTMKNIFGASADAGGDALTTLGDAFKELRRVTGLPEMQDTLRRIFTAFHQIASTVTTVVGAALAGLLPIAAPFAELMGQIAETAKGPLTAFFQFVADHTVIFGSLAAAVLGIAAGMKLWALGTAAVTAAQAILSAVMAASPFTLVALAVVGLAAAFAYAWHESETFRNVVTGVWEAIKNAFASTWDWINTWIVQPFRKLYDILVGHSIVPDLVRGIIGWFTKLWTETKRIFTALKNWVVALWKDLWNTVRSKWDSFWSGLKSAISGAWRTVRDGFTSLKTGLTNTWNSLWNGIRDKITSVFSTISSKISSFKNGMKSAFSSLRDSLGTIWNGVKSKIGAPIKWVIDHVYNNGLRRMWNSIAGKISSKITLPAISLGFNKGGVVPGTGSSDTVPAMLTPGERILSNGQVAALGGHRGIDAMLGRDRPTKTGGNPSRQQQRQREQAGQQHYGSGGIIGKVTSGIGGAISGAYDWAKDVVIGGLKKAAQAAINNLVRPLINQIPGSGVGSLLKGLANKAVDGMLGWFGNEDKKAVGGPAVQRALSWVKTQNGKAYQWAGNGNPSWDCSGLMSAIESVIRGEKPHRRWATGSFSGSNGPAGWVRNLNSPFMIGITNAGVGHTAGTLAGMNVESSGGAGVHMGKSARGYNNSLFTSRWGFAPAAKYDSGGLLAKGATMAINSTGRPERILDPRQTEMFEQMVAHSGGGGSQVTLNMTVNCATLPSPSERRRFATLMADDTKEALRKLDKSRA
ncbi:hypothetical protein [Streptomyces sp. NPDC002685]|uniref:hypothetical protein n=1 Tax=Streptomyces sp. NPDC002685 TaxID=3154540 RepID=UPI003317C193